MSYLSESRPSSRARAFFQYMGISFICGFTTASFIMSGSRYGAENLFSALDRDFSIFIFIVYSSLITPVLLNWALKRTTIHPVLKSSAPSLSLGIILLLINLLPLQKISIVLLSSWIISLIFALLRSRSFAGFELLHNRLLLTGIILLLISIPYHWWVRDEFPGQFSSIQSRQEWALNRFRWTYAEALQAVRKCPAVAETLGKIEDIAPTEGRNYSIGGGPGDVTQYGFTLEVVGSIKTGTVEVSNNISINSRTGEISPSVLKIRNHVFGSEVVPLQCQ